MAYDVVAESVALIESRSLQRFTSLSRRRHFLAMAVDVDRDLAVTMFARRGVGHVAHETHVLVFRDEQWHLLGGGGSRSDDDLLADRQATLPRHLTWRFGAVNSPEENAIASSGSGGVRDFADVEGNLSDFGRWISYADCQVTSEVTSVTASGRQLNVPWHGHIAVVWSGPRTPLVVAYGSDGTPLGEIELADPL